MYKKIILFVVLILILVLGSLFLLKKTKQQSLDVDSISNKQETWKTYSNPEWGFQLSYPSNWSYLQKKGGSSTPFSVQFSDINLDYYSPTPGTVLDKFINVVLYKTSKTIDQYSSEDTKGSLESKKEIIISGIRSILQESKSNDKTYISAYIPKDGYIYIFETIISDNKNVSEVKSIFQEIIGSFEFNN